MDLADFTVPVSRFGTFEQAWTGPIAFVPLENEGQGEDNDSACEGARPLRLPSCPVIGIGSSDHPLTSQMDTLVEAAFDLSSLARVAVAHPRAAAALVQVLRLTSEMSVGDALCIESMAYAMLQGSAEHQNWLSRREPKALSAPGNVLVERFSDRLDITLDRAWAGNAIDRPMRDALAEAFTFAALDKDVAHITLRARGKAFSLGADLEEFGTTTDPATAHHIRALTLPAHVVMGCADRLHVQIDGACIGGGLELAAFASRITATSRSWFQLPELAMGIIPGAGGCVSVPRRIGPQRTALLVLSGRRISARVALEWGLIDALVDDFSVDDRGSDIG